MSLACYYNFCIDDNRGEVKTASVGPFAVVEKSIFYAAANISDTETRNGFKENPSSFDEIWQTHFAEAFDVDGDYFPRGRVIYMVNEKCYTIFADRCLNGHDIRRVAKAFGLEEENYKIVYDEDYKCFQCL